MYIVQNQSDIIIWFLEKNIQLPKLCKKKRKKKILSITKLKKRVNSFNFAVILNIPTSRCTININYSFFLFIFFYIRFGESRTDKRNSKYAAVNKRKKMVVKNVMK